MNGPVPLVVVATAVPLHRLLHVTLVTEVEAVIAGGLVIVTGWFIMQPFVSVTVTVYVPGLRLEAVAVVCPPGAHEYE